MQCFIYKNLKKEFLYLFLRNKDNFESLPGTLSGFGKWEFVVEIKLTPERKLAKEDAAKVIAGLNEKGYFIQLPAIDAPAPMNLQ